MMAAARLLSRLLGFVLLVLLAAAGLVAAVFCIQGDHDTLSLPALADDLSLGQLRDHVGGFLDQITASGPIAVIAVLCGVGAVVVGLVLLAATWLRARPRRIVLVRTEHGTLGALQRPLARLAASQAERPDEIARARARALAGRTGDGGRLRVRARTIEHTDPRRAQVQARASVAQLTDGLPLRLRVTARRPNRRVAARSRPTRVV
jgi:hypothetical protein